MITFEEFKVWEQTTRDTIDFKKIYVDVAGDLVAGLMLSQIIFWHLPNKQGGSKMRVKKDGYIWIAKAYADWYDEVRITEWQAPRALKILEDKGIIEKRIYKFDGSPTIHIRIIEDKFLSAISFLVKDSNPNRGKTRIQTGERLESLTENTTEINSITLKKENDDLFEACLAIYEKKKGSLVTDGNSFSLMINNFKAHGVTADDYASAITAMDADPRYSGTKPTSYERWALGIADRRNNPPAPARGQSIAKTNQELLEEMYERGEL